MENLRKLDEFDVLRIARERGIIIGGVLMDSAKFLKLCKVLGFDIKKFGFLF